MDVTTKEIIEQVSKIDLNVRFVLREITVQGGTFVVLRVVFDRNSYLKGIIQGFLKSCHTNNANQNGDMRTSSKKFDKQLEGVLGEIAILEYLKKFITFEKKGGCKVEIVRYDDVRTDEFVSSKDEYDIKIITPSGKEFIIEARASFSYKFPLGESALKALDTLGAYKSPIKQFESDSDFYIRPLFQLRNPSDKLSIDDISLFNLLLNDEVDLYLTGGVTFDFMNKNGYDTKLKQPNTKYRAVKIINGLDIVQLTNLIRETVCK